MGRLSELSKPAPEEGRVFAAIGIAPEPGAYGTAKFSRSAAPFARNVEEISGQQAAQFLNTFYFQYGHPSIADLDHFAVGFEGWSMIHALALWQENLVDGQESSTRYQNYDNRRVWVPVEIRGTHLEDEYRKVTDRLFDTYQGMQEPMRRYLLDQVGGYPPELDKNYVDRTLKARGFDRLRYLLPLGTRTGLGLIMSARTAERTIVRLVSSPIESIRVLGEQLKSALCEEPAFNLAAEKVLRLYEENETLNEDFYTKLREAILADVKVAPTLAKYTAASPYQQSLYQACKEAARQYLGEAKARDRGVELHFMVHPEVDMAATVLYRGSSHSYKQAREVVEGLSGAEIGSLIDLLNQARGSHDGLAKENAAGYPLIFDIVMDLGALRDMWRHRKNEKFLQDISPALGYDVPDDILGAGLYQSYREAVAESNRFYDVLEEQFPGVGQFTLPMATKAGLLMKMDVAQLAYIAEIRTAPGGHFSYQEIAYQMYEQTANELPHIARHIRVKNPEEENFWKR